MIAALSTSRRSRQDPSFVNKVLTAALYLAALALLLEASPNILAEVSQISEGGLIPRQAYAGGQNEDINLYNLNLVVSIPLSPTYPVSPHFSYGLTAYYNGSVHWSHDGTYSDFGRDFYPRSWVGAGWTLDFGKVEIDGCIGSQWISQGGGVHDLRDSRYGSTIDGCLPPRNLVV